MTFSLRSSDGDIHPEQVAYVDGYGIAERLLEGVRFKVEVKTNEEGLSELVCNGVHPDDESYMVKFSKAQREDWEQQAVEQMTQLDHEATAEDGTEVYWGDM